MKATFTSLAVFLVLLFTGVLLDHIYGNTAGEWARVGLGGGLLVALASFIILYLDS